MITVTCLITFASTHLAIRTERLLKNSYPVTMIPTPRELSASCGLALMLEPDALDGAMAVLEPQGFEGMRLYRVTRTGDGPRHYEELDWRLHHAPGHTAQ